jgi:hypothetical protein
MIPTRTVRIIQIEKGWNIIGPDLPDGPTQVRHRSTAGAALNFIKKQDRKVGNIITTIEWETANEMGTMVVKALQG